MSQDILCLLALFMGACAVLTLVAIPLALRRIKPNSWYGFRTPSTLRKPELWYDTNQTAGRGLLLTGITGLVAAVPLALLFPKVDEYATIMAVLVLGGVGLTLLAAWRRHLA